MSRQGFWLVVGWCVLVLFVPVGAAGQGQREAGGSEAMQHGGQHSDRPQIVIHGAAGDVSGSLTALEWRAARWLVDCGAYYPEGEGTAEQREQRARRGNAQLPIPASSIDAIFLTHAHLDHIGRLPLLVAEGYEGPVYLTEPTAALASVMLPMQLRFDDAAMRNWTLTTGTRHAWMTAHWRADCHFVQQIASENLLAYRGNRIGLRDWLEAEHPAVLNDRDVVDCRRCTALGYEAIATLFRTVAFDEPVPLSATVTARFQRAGHIPGAASIIIEHTGETEGKPWRVVISGDLGNALSPLHPPAQPAPPADLLLVEGTYAGNVHGVEGEADRLAFRQALAEVVGRDGIVLVPAFAMDRTQKILYEVTLAKREGLIAEDVPVLTPSPSASAVSRLYRRHQRDWFALPVADDGQAFSPPGLVEDRAARSLIERPELPRPSIIIATSAMLDHAVSQAVLPRIADDPRNGVLLVGYQAPGSPGARLAAGELALVDEEGEGEEAIPLRLTVRRFHGFSGHGDARDIDGWLAGVGREAVVVLYHGQTEALHERVEQLRAQGFEQVLIAEPGQVIEVPTGGVPEGSSETADEP